MGSSIILIFFDIGKQGIGWNLFKEKIENNKYKRKSIIIHQIKK